jgi:RNA polymerase sigma-70 factor (ECF subfamily)
MHAGDERALGALYDRYAALVHRAVVRTIGDRDDADEVVEETFWQAWRQAGRFDPRRAGVPSWLVVIARSRALDRVRGRWRRMQAQTGSLAEGAADALEDADRPSPLDDVAVEERRRRVTAAMATLPAEQRRTVELAYFGGMSQREIAAATGAPLGTVKTRARLALMKLKEALAALREDGEPLVAVRGIAGQFA